MRAGRVDAAPDAVVPFEALDRRVVTAWRFRIAVQTIVLSVVAAVVAGEAGLAAGPLAAGAAVFVAGVSLLIVVPPARYRAWSYRVGRSDLVLRRGMLWRAVSVVPHARIQHVDTRRGPVERWLGLARVVIFTAGSTGAVLTIPGLALAVAESLRDRLAVLGGGDDAV